MDHADGRDAKRRDVDSTHDGIVRSGHLADRVVRIHQEAEAKLAEMKAFLDSAPRRQGKLTKTAEAKARKILKAG